MIECPAYDEAKTRALLRQALAGRAWSNPELADVIGRSRSLVERAMLGRCRLTGKVAAEIAAALGLGLPEGARPPLPAVAEAIRRRARLQRARARMRED